MERKLLIFFIFIFFLNIWYLSIFGGGCDIAFFISWGERLFSQSLRGFYNRNLDVDHLPGYLLILRSLAWLWSKIYPFELYIPKELIFKLPAILSDFFTGLIIFLILKKENPKWAIFSLPLYWFNAAVFGNSVLWGQFDTMAAFFLVLTFFSLWKKKPSLAGLSLGFGCVTKPPNLLYFPFFALWTLLSFPKYKFLLFLLFFLFSFFPPFLPFLDGQITASPRFVLGRFVYITNRYHQVSLGASNFWGLTPYLHVQRDNLLGPFGLTLYTWGLLIFFVLAIVLLVLFFRSLIKKKKSILLKSLIFSLLALVIYLFPTRVHERHLFSLFPFLLLTSLLEPLFLFLYVVYSFTYAVTVAFGLYWPQRGAGFWLGKGVVVFSAVNVLSFIVFFLMALMRINYETGQQAKDADG